MATDPRRLDRHGKALAKGTAAAAALYLGGDCEDARAVIMHVPTTLSVTGDSNLNWNIDGTGAREYRLQAARFVGGTMSSIQYTYLAFTRQTINNGRGFVQLTADGIGDFRNLPLNFNVGATLVANYEFDDRLQHRATSVGGFQDAKGFTSGVDGYIGFRFDPGDGFHYGWARINMVVSASNSHVLTVQEWAYETTAGTSIQVGAVPEPNAAMLVGGLGLLAAGIAGVRQWRQQTNREDSEKVIDDE